MIGVVFYFAEEGAEELISGDIGPLENGLVLVGGPETELYYREMVIRALKT